MPDLDWSRWPHFKASEFACRCGCGRADMDPDFLDKLEAARVAAGVPFVVNSGFRCPAHDAAVGTSGTPGAGPHTTGHAADIAFPAGPRSRAILGGAVAAGIDGLGLRAKGPDRGRYIHLDDLAPRTWNY